MTTWVKVYNSMPQNPKLLRAGDRAAWLYVCGLCYSNEHLTNGFIPSHALPVVAPGVKRAEALAGSLVSAGLWHEVEDGWSIHDYGQHQRSAEEIRERRAADAARKAAARSNGSPANVRADSTEDSAESPRGVQPLDVDVDVETSRRAERAEEKANEDDTRLCRLLGEFAKQRNPKFRVKSRPRWLTDMRLLRERDGNEPAEIEAAIRWVFTDTGRDAEFWADVIQSPGNLREHFPQVWAKMQAAPRLRAVAQVEDSASYLARKGVA